MSAKRSMELYCEAHMYQRRAGNVLPCPWPRCEKGAKVPNFYAPRVPLNVTYPYTIDGQLEIDSYTSRELRIAGDGTTSTLWHWVKR